MRLKCTAFLDDIFMRSKEATVAQIRPQTAILNSRDENSDTYESLFGQSGETSLMQGTHSGAVKSALDVDSFSDLTSAASTSLSPLTSAFLFLLSYCSFREFVMK